MHIVAVVRRELCMNDNPLIQGADRHEIIPLFVLDDAARRESNENLARLFFFALAELARRIADLGGRLYRVHQAQQEAFFSLARPDLVRFYGDIAPHAHERNGHVGPSARPPGYSLSDAARPHVDPGPRGTVHDFRAFLQAPLSAVPRERSPVVSDAGAVRYTRAPGRGDTVAVRDYTRFTPWATRRGRLPSSSRCCAITAWSPSPTSAGFRGRELTPSSTARRSP